MVESEVCLVLGLSRPGVSSLALSGQGSPEQVSPVDRVLSRPIASRPGLGGPVWSGGTNESLKETTE